MRNGKLMIEDSPLKLLEDFNCNLLEDIMVKLCVLDERQLEELKNKERKFSTNSISQRAGDVLRKLSLKKSNSAQTNGNGSTRAGGRDSTPSPPIESQQPKSEDYSTKTLRRSQALVLKNLLVLFRAPA
jgi:hypothetical protein